MIRRKKPAIVSGRIAPILVATIGWMMSTLEQHRLTHSSVSV